MFMVAAMGVWLQKRACIHKEGKDIQCLQLKQESDIEYITLVEMGYIT